MKGGPHGKIIDLPRQIAKIRHRPFLAPHLQTTSETLRD